MRIHLLSLALRDIEAGRRFYEIQKEGLGEDIQIWRVLDCRQNPARTKSALIGR